jgi:hypothetical protein
METSLILRILYIPGEASLFTGGIEFYPLGRKPGRRLRERALQIYPQRNDFDLPPIFSVFSNSLSRNDLELEIRNPPRFFLKLGHAM